MRINAEVSIRGAAEPRRSERFGSALAGGIQGDGPVRLRAEVVNVSSHGCRVELGGQLEEGALVSIAVCGWAPWDARVVWSKRGSAGLEFLRPLHPSFVQRMINAPPRLTNE